MPKPAKPAPAPPAYFDDAQRAAWDELAEACGRLDSTADRLRAEQAALLLAEMRSAPELFQTARHAQLRLMLADLLPNGRRMQADEPPDLSSIGADLERIARRRARRP